MPWDSTKEGGTERLFCEVDPAVDGAAAVWLGSARIVPNGDPKIPPYTIGTSDFAAELVAWRKSTIDDDADPDEGWVSGLLETTIPNFLDNRAVVGIDPPSSNPALNNVRGETVCGSAGISDLALTDWHHFVANGDRDGNLDFWVDGVLRASAAIGACSGTSLTGGIYPYSPTIISFLDTVDGLPALGLQAALLLMREFALHQRLLTTTEIQAAAAAFRCNQITETIARYKAGFILGDIVKDTDSTHIVASLKVGLPAPVSATLFTILAEDGEIMLEDLSGNGNHFGLPSQLAYTNAQGNRAVTAFATALPEAGP